jgi:dolichyl-phosphate beta-glucosyltransferase
LAVSHAQPQPAVLLAVPVHDEGERLAAFLADLAALSPGSGAPPTRVVVVDDGSRPATARLQAEAVEAAARRFVEAGSPHSIELRTCPGNQGKGAAIRMAWGAGEGARWLGFVDGDGAVPAREVWRVAAQLGQAPAFEALVAARLRGVGRRVQRAALRELQGRAFSLLVEAVLGLGLRDPQCGLKFFRAAWLAPILPALQERRWLLDLELLLLLARRGAMVAEEGIDWQESGRSKVLPGVDPLRMLVGLLQMRARLGWVRTRSVNVTDLPGACTAQRGPTLPVHAADSRRAGVGQE